MFWRNTFLFMESRWKLMDTAGIRETEDVVEKIGVDRARAYGKDADLILYVVDSSTPLDENDEEIIGDSEEEKAIVLYNKTDLELGGNERDAGREIQEACR